MKGVKCTDEFCELKCSVLLHANENNLISIRISNPYPKIF